MTASSRINVTQSNSTVTMAPFTVTGNAEYNQAVGTPFGIPREEIYHDIWRKT